MKSVNEHFQNRCQFMGESTHRSIQFSMYSHHRLKRYVNSPFLIKPQKVTILLYSSPLTYGVLWRQIYFIGVQILKECSVNWICVMWNLYYTETQITCNMKKTQNYSIISSSIIFCVMPLSEYSSFNTSRRGLISIYTRFI